MTPVIVEAERNSKSATGHKVKTTPRGWFWYVSRVVYHKTHMKDLEKKLYKHLKDRNWHNLRPVDLAKSIMIEGAELLELFQWENLSLEEIKKNKAKKEEIKSELADVLIYAIDMAVLLELDTEKIIRAKLAKTAKKYPAKLMKQNTDREPGTESAYWQIKKAYRQKKQ